MSILGIIGTIFIVVLVIMILRWIFLDKNTLQTLQSGKNFSTISASSLETNNGSSNFAYSIWVYVNNWDYRYGETKVIYGRMGGKSSENNGSIEGVSGVDPCPLVVLGAVENNVSVSVGCYPGANQTPTTGGNTIVHTCELYNIPIQKWVNLVVSVNGRTMDLYMDGKLVRSCYLPGVVAVNNNANIYVTPNGGFDGWTSKFQYYPNALNPQEVWNIYTRGYNTWMSNFGTYQVQISLVENGTTQKSVTI